MQPQTIAETLLGERFNGKLQLCVEAQLQSSNRTRVYRCRVMSGPATAPPTVIVKQATHAYGDTFDGAVDGNVWNDWAGLQFVSAVASDVASPQVYAGDPATGLIVLEDLGDRPSLGDILAGADDEKAADSLIRYGAMLGTLHARTRGQEHAFHRMRAGLGAYDPEREFYQHQYTRLRQRLRDLTSTLAITPPPGAAADLEIVLAALQHPGPFLVYRHGDPTPLNVLVNETTPYLLDFEYGSYGHGLMEGVYARMLFPSSGFVNHIPAPVIERVEAAYRSAFVPGCPAAADDTFFAQAVVVACAYWAITHSVWLPFADLIEEDQRWGIATMRQRVIVRAERFADTVEEASYLEALGETFRMIANKLRSIWPEAADSLPLYPAFRATH